jgi:hypothetical protein
VGLEVLPEIMCPTGSLDPVTFRRVPSCGSMACSRFTRGHPGPTARHAFRLTTHLASTHFSALIIPIDRSGASTRSPTGRPRKRGSAPRGLRQQSGDGSGRETGRCGKTRPPRCHKPGLSIVFKCRDEFALVRGNIRNRSCEQERMSGSSSLPKAEPMNEPFLPPIEKPNGLIMKLVYAMSRRQFGKVLTPLKGYAARLPNAFGTFYGRV